MIPATFAQALSNSSLLSVVLWKMRRMRLKNSVKANADQDYSRAEQGRLVKKN